MPAWRAMAEAVVRDYPRDEIIQHHAELQGLLADMAARSAGGKSASGRYKKYDTARLQYSTAVAFPTRQFGTRIDAALAAVNSSPITSRDSEGYAPPQPAQVSTAWGGAHQCLPRIEGMQAHAQLPDCAAWCAPRTRARVCTHLQQHTAPHRHRLASQMNAHEHTPPARRNQIHT